MLIRYIKSLFKKPEQPSKEASIQENNTEPCAVITFTITNDGVECYLTMDNELEAKDLILAGLMDELGPNLKKEFLHHLLDFQEDNPHLVYDIQQAVTLFEAAELAKNIPAICPTSVFKAEE